MKDTIYREDAIKAFKSLPTIEGLGLQALITVDDAIKILNGLPSAQPERKKGKWKRKIVDSGYNADWVCSECGDRWKYDFINFNFCPNCGADMRMEE